MGVLLDERGSCDLEEAGARVQDGIRGRSAKGDAEGTCAGSDSFSGCAVDFVVCPAEVCSQG